ncbi:MAG: hypothetical protein GWM87_03175 [Xanthomonadales bacterium]|nr:hypothetical protein [Xanthomonadales bacterium]NIX12047.1 hypothetical protein [Xanthomonadales bacterium]
MKRYAPRLEQALADSHRLAERLDDPGFPLQTLESLQDWQRDRLAGTYADLIAVDRYRAAAEFFLAELYGGLHFRERDQEVERVLPVMIRMLRDDMLLALAEAFELQALSLDLDICMGFAMRDAGWNSLDVDRYGRVYRACGREGDRTRQIELIRQLGLVLNELVHHRLVLLMVRMLRAPARAAGFGRLQSFLEEGLFAFRAMGDGTEFVEAIHRRETEAMERLFRGSENPFG